MPSRREGAGVDRSLPLFAYGTLLVDEIIAALLGRVPAYRAASAPGWRAACLPGRGYPGLVREPRAHAPGRVYVDLSGDEWARLDEFEDDEYALVPVSLGPGGTALAYVWTEACLDTVWTVEHLNAREVDTYVMRLRRPG